MARLLDRSEAIMEILGQYFLQSPCDCICLLFFTLSTLLSFCLFELLEFFDFKTGKVDVNLFMLHPGLSNSTSAKMASCLAQQIHRAQDLSSSFRSVPPRSNVQNTSLVSS